MSTPQPRKARLVLPTIETCHLRSSRAGLAICGLIESLVGPQTAPISIEACEACCRSFPPSPSQLNPVVAGLLYDSVVEILAQGGTTDCNIEQATKLRQESLGAIDVVHPPHLTTLPARSVDPCCWFGELLDDDVANVSSDTREPVHHCRHPRHERTTLSQCRVCRDWCKHEPRSRFLSLDELIPLPNRRAGPHLRSWAIGVTTAPRRSCTLEHTLDSIFRAGWHDPRLFLDGTIHMPKKYEHLPVSWRDDSIGAWPTWYMALAELVLRSPSADAYVMLQDDVVLYDRENLSEYLQRALWPGDRPGIVSLFYNGSNTSPGWHRTRDEWPFSAQALVIAPEVARAMLCDTGLSRWWLAAAGGNHIPIPEIIAPWVHQNGIEAWYATPCLAQHIGNTSTIWTDASLRLGRRATWFSGGVETEYALHESLSDFPEGAFECPRPYREEYLKRVVKGQQQMRARRVVFCGLCHDVRVFLPRTAGRIERLGKMFEDYRVVLLENDSVDATNEFLADWQSQNARIDLLGEYHVAGNPERHSGWARAEWMAEYRNQCRRRVLEQYPDFDFVVVVDMNLSGGWSYDGIANTFGELNWDMVGSYRLVSKLDRGPGKSLHVHHDAGAFRPVCPSDDGNQINYDDFELQRGQPLLPVQSCFGGLAVYRMDCLKATEYGVGESEHVEFHQRLRRLGMTRLYLNPSQIVLH